MRGLNLQDADPRVALNVVGKLYQLIRTSLTQTSASFQIPEGLLSAADLEARVVRGEVQLRHTKAAWFGLFGTSTRQISTELSIGVLPKYLGILKSIETFKKTQKRQYTDWKNREFNFSSGSLTSDDCAGDVLYSV
jgi:hypothetical protein